MNARTLARALLLAAAVVLLVPSRTTADEQVLSPVLRSALVKVHATRQGYERDSPWNEEDPRYGLQTGIVVRPGLVLTPYSALQDLRMVEVSVANSARRYPASLAHADEAVDLALVRIEDEALTSSLSPMALGEPITVDEEFTIWQLGDSDLLERSTGVVQRVAAYGPRLQLTAKANLGERGNGQVATRDGKVVGLVTYTRSSAQEARLTAIETIRHFVEDFDDGDYRGFGRDGIWTQELLREDLRAHHGLGADDRGIGIVRVTPEYSGHDCFEPGDVLVSVSGHALDDEGMFVHPVHGRLDWRWLLTGATHPGETVGARVLRKGEPVDVEVAIVDVRPEDEPIPRTLQNRRPPYLVVGGMVLLELTRESSAGSYLIQRYQRRSMWDPPDDRKRIVYLSRVLADESNKGLENLYAAPVATVNGRKIGELADVVAALAAPEDGFHVVVFEGLNPPFVVRASELDAIDARVAERYRIPELRYLGDDEAGDPGDEGEATGEQ